MREIEARALTIDCAFAGERAALAALHRELVGRHTGIVSFYERQLTVEDVFLAASSREVA